MLLASVRSEGGCLHSLKREFVVEALETLHDRVSHRRNARVADHTVGLASVEMPYRKLALLLVDGKHSVDEVSVTLSLEDAVERHSRSVSVPE